MYISQTNKDPIALLRVPVAGGPAELIPVQGKFQMTNGLLSPAAVDAHGQILIEAASPNLFFYRPIIVDPARKSATPVNVIYEGDVWTTDGPILAVGARFSSTIWRFSV